MTVKYRYDDGPKAMMPEDPAATFVGSDEPPGIIDTTRGRYRLRSAEPDENGVWHYAFIAPEG